MPFLPTYNNTYDAERLDLIANPGKVITLWIGDARNFTYAHQRSGHALTLVKDEQQKIYNRMYNTHFPRRSGFRVSKAHVKGDSPYTFRITVSYEPADELNRVDRERAGL